MSNPRLQKTLMFLLISVLLAVVFFHLVRDIRDNDFFWHLKTGQWTWEHREIPLKDPFSFTTVGFESVRERFIMSSYWLSQVIFSLFYSAAGMPGIVLLRFIVVGSLLFIMIRRREGDSVIYTALLLLFLGLMLKSYPIERPQVISFVFFALLLYLLSGRKESDGSDHAENGYGRSLYISVPLLMLVWANMHGGYVAGAATIALYIACEGLKFAHPSLAPMGKADYKILLVAGVLGLVSCLVNPNTYHVFSAEIVFQQDYLTFNNIEYQSTARIFRRFHDYSIIVYWLVLSLTVAGLLINIRKIDITEAALLALLGYFSFTSVRYIAFFMIAALPPVGRIFSDNRLLKPFRAFILAASLAFALLLTQDNLTFETLSSGRWIDKQKFPVEAADFILANDLKGNMYNYFNWGGYLIWRLAPERKVFIDGRTLYSHIYLQSDLIDNADKRSFDGRPAWKAAFDDYNIQYTITPVSLPLVKALSEDNDWTPVFWRHNSIIFVRNTPENRNVIQSFSVDKGYF